MSEVPLYPQVVHLAGESVARVGGSLSLPPQAPCHLRGGRLGAYGVACRGLNPAPYTLHDSVVRICGDSETDYGILKLHIQ